MASSWASSDSFSYIVNFQEKYESKKKDMFRYEWKEFPTLLDSGGW